MMRRPTAAPGPETQTAHGGVMGLLQSGLAAQRAGRLPDAERCYRQALAAEPENPDALQLLGLLARSAGRPDVAEELMRRSLSARPDQPHVLSNLGNLYMAEGRPVEALDRYDAALRLTPDNADLHVSRAKALHRLDRLTEAAAAATRALDLAPNHAGALVVAGQVQAACGALVAAESSFRRALDRAAGGRSPSPALLNGLGHVLVRLDRAAEAEPLFRQALAADPRLKEVWHNLGNCLGARGRHGESVECYRRVLALDPLFRDAHVNLNRMLWSLGRTEAVLGSVRDLSARHPDDARALEIAAALELEFGRDDTALAHARKAAQLAPGNPQMLRTLGLVLLRTGHPADAVAPLSRAQDMAPMDGEVATALATARLRTGDRAGAEAATVRRLAVDPHDQLAWAIRGTCWRLAGDPRAGWLHDLDRCVGVFDLPAPAGWTDLDAFHRDLLAVLDRLHDTVNEPAHLTLKHGTQTGGGLFGVERAEPVEALRRQILQTAARFAASLPENEPDHPFFARAHVGTTPTRPIFSGSWSSRLRGSGHHTNHVHPAGWISGVYYIDLPPGMGADGQAEGARGPAGWLTFGIPNLGPEIALPPARSVEPQRGRLVLFPSHLWHGTVPFQGPGHRTTIAFDMVPGPG